jgi:acetyl-CoA carboxylase biotin carboxyl carrier protein
MSEDAIAQVQQLTQWLAGSDIDLLELSGPGQSIRLRRHGSGAPAPLAVSVPAAVSSPPTIVRASSVGVLLHAHPLREHPLVRAGQPIASGETLALLKIGTLLLAVTAPRAGTLARVLAAEGSTVGFGDVLFELE